MADYRSNIKDEVEVTPYRKIQKGSIIGEMIKDRTITKNKLAEGVIPPINNKHNYSTEEQIVGKWIDDKPIYEKTINCNKLELNTNVWIDAFSVLDLNIDQIIEHKIIGTYQSGQCDLGNNELVSSRITPEKDKFQIWKSNYTATLDYVVLQYTKTTDVPNA